MVKIYLHFPYFIIVWYSIKHRDKFFFYPLVTILSSVVACRGFKAWGGTRYSVAYHHYTKMEKLKKWTILALHVPRNYGEWLISMQCAAHVSKKEMNLNALKSCEGRNYLNRSQSESWQKNRSYALATELSVPYWRRHYPPCIIAVSVWEGGSRRENTRGRVVGVVSLGWQVWEIFNPHPRYTCTYYYLIITTNSTIF